MATNFSPCKGSYVLNQFPSNVMFGMNGFHVSASGAIQGHHGPLVILFFMLFFSSCMTELVIYVREYLGCCHDMTEILFKAALNYSTDQPTILDFLLLTKPY